MRQTISLRIVSAVRASHSRNLPAGTLAPRAGLRAAYAYTQATSLTNAPARGLIAPSRAALAEKSTGADNKQGILKSLLHGSDQAKSDGMTMQSHSSTVARGKYIHEIQRHEVKVESVDEYKKVLAEFYPAIHEDPKLGARLTGSWEVTIGDLETFYHIWEYDGYAGYDAARASYEQSDLKARLDAAIRPHIRSRSNWITQEFAFWPTSKPRVTDGLYELRTYHLKPGHLLEWEQQWRRGLEARRKFVEPIGAWFTQIGGLHTVFHIWAYPSLEERKRTRDAAWQVETWNDTVSQTVKLIDRMHAQIMRPLDYSPLK